MPRVVLLHPDDNVLTCLASLDDGEEVAIETPAGPETLVTTGAVPYAHKIARRGIEAGVEIVKYGEVIGVASSAIAPGDWVHVHNVESVRARGDRA